MPRSDASTVPSYKEAIRDVVARSVLRDLVIRYARGIDRRDRDLLLSCFHGDAVDEHGTMFQGSPGAFADWQPKVMAPFEVTAHYIMNSDFRIADDRAEGEIYFIAYYRTSDGQGQEGMTGGRYLDHYECRGGHWGISRRNLVWDFAFGQPIDQERLSSLRTLGPTGAGAIDPSFDILSLFGSASAIR